MDQFATDRIRNVVLLSHSGAGKTSLVEAMQFATKAIGRMGRVEDGNTVSDFEAEEHARQTSLQLSVVPCIWNDHKINIIDTPGYADFIGEAESALRVADAAVLVISAPGGVEVGAELMWKRLRDRGLPTLIFVNKMDRENADYNRALSQIRSSLGNSCAPINLPVGAEKDFSGVVDILKGNIPGEIAAAADAAREHLTEAIAETDDALTEKYLEHGELSPEEVLRGLHTGVNDGAVVPILAGAATASLGVSELLDAIVSYLPSPDERPAAKAMKGDTEIELKTDANGPLAAFIFKTSADPFVGKLSYFRVYSGTLTGNTDVWDANKNQAERVGQVFVPVGKSQENAHAIVAGDIGSVAKLAHAVTGDTLTTKADAVTLHGIEFPPAVYAVAVHPHSKQDLDKLSTALHRLVEEDPTLHLTREAATAELVVYGMGDTHVDVMAERAKRKFGVELELAPPRVAYRESISKTVKVDYKHKKQSGGHGQYGHVLIRLEPMERGGGYAFGNEVVGGNVPKEYVPAVEKGALKAMEEGIFAGYPVTDLKVVLYDGSSHPVDSSGQSFEIAGSMAVKKGVLEADPILLEPVMRVKMVVPEHFAGAVVGDLNTRRARIVGMTPSGGIADIEAFVPMAEIQQYATSLRAHTQGRGTFTMEFDHYGEVPQHIAHKVVEAQHKEPAKV